MRSTVLLFILEICLHKISVRKSTNYEQWLAPTWELGRDKRRAFTFLAYQSFRVALYCTHMHTPKHVVRTFLVKEYAHLTLLPSYIHTLA